MAANSAIDNAPATILTQRGSFLSRFMPGLRADSGVRFAAIRGLRLFLAFWIISDFGLASLHSEQNRASVGTSTWHRGHFIDNPRGEIGSTLAVRAPAIARRGPARFGE